MIYQRTEETIDPSPNGRTTTWINSLMSDSQYSVLNGYSQRVAVVVRRSDLIHDELEHDQLIGLYPNPNHFYNVVGRIACAIAETRPTTQEDVQTELNWTIRMMVGYATDTLALSIRNNAATDEYLAANRTHVVRCARNLARLMPGGLWSDFTIQNSTPDSIIFVGTRHAVDYR